MEITTYEDDGVNPVIYSYIIFVIISAIIAISILFELVEEHALEKSEGWIQPIVSMVFRELTIMGFIGLVMSSITKVCKDALDNLACNGYFAGQEESCLKLQGLKNQTATFHVPKEILERGWICLENPFIEITENAHLTLFGVMMLYLIIVLANLSIARRQLRNWRTFEDFCMIYSIEELCEKENIAFRKRKNTCWERCSFACRCVPSSTVKRCNKIFCNAIVIKQHLLALERLRYATSRIAFIKSNNARAKNNDHRLDAQFDMKEYLSQQTTKKLTETVELKISNWLAIYFIFISFVFASYILRVNDSIFNENFLPILLAGGSVLAMWISFAVITVVSWKVEKIANTMVHPGTQEENESVDETDLQTPLLATKNSSCTPTRTRLTAPRRNSLTQVSSQKNNLQTIAETAEYKNEKESKDILYSRTLITKRNDICASVGLANPLGVEEAWDFTEHDLLFPLYKYNYNGSLRETPKKDCFGNQPNHQEATFCGIKHGDKAMYSYLTSTQLVMALYIGTFVVNFSHPVFQFIDTWEMTAIVYLVAILPVIGHLIQFSVLLPSLILVTSIHEMSSSQLTAKTTHIMRSRKALRMLMYACAIKDAHKVAMKVRTKGLRGSTFSKLTRSEQAAIEKECRVKTIAQGQDILLFGHSNHYLYVIISGFADVFVRGKKVATLSAPQEFGLLSLLNGVTCTATVRSSPQCPLVCYMLDLPTYNRYFKAKSKMALAVAKSEASMNAAISFHEGTESKDETKSGGKQANSLIQSLGDNKHHEGISAVVSASKMARKLSLKLKRRHDIVERKEGDLSFAERVRKGGRPKKAIEAYRRSALVDLFAMMDHDMGGTVDEEELTQFLISLFAPNSSKLSDTEIRQIELMIAGLDENGDGEVSVQEFLNVMEPIVAQMEEEETPEQITARMWDVLDSDSSGSVSISEFRDVLAKVGLTMSYEEVRELFAEFDDDGSGALELDELLSFMKSQI